MRKSLLIIMLFPAPTLAQGLGVEFNLESTTLDVGETVGGQIVCTNVEDPTQPQIPPVDGLEIEVGSSGSVSMMTSMINGRTTKRNTVTYPVRIVAKKEGSYLVGPVVIPAKDQTHHARAVQVTVRPPQQASKPEGDQIVFVRMSVEPTSLYVTQSYDATLTIGIRKVEIEGRVHEIRSLLQLVDAAGSELSVFGPQFSQSTAVLADAAGAKHQYILYKDVKTLRAEQVGQLMIGPVYVKVDYPLELRRNIWGDVSVARKKKESARADAIAVEVKGPPLENRPTSFRGAIGKYSFEVSAKPARVEQGRPITLTIAIQGQPVEGVAAPDLSAHQELLSRFDFTADEPSADIEGGNRKVFRKAIFPRQLGAQTIPSLEWSYFDPEKESFVTLSSPAVAIEVLPGTSAPLADAATEEEGVEATRLTAATGGIAPNYTDIDGLLTNHASFPSAPVAATALVLPPALCMTAMLVTRRRRRMEDVAFARKKEALPRAYKRLRRARSAKTGVEQRALLAESLKSYISDRLALPPGELTPADARRVLLVHGISEKIVAEVAGFLEEHDAARYAPALTDDFDVDDGAKRIKNWIRSIEASGT